MLAKTSAEAFSLRSDFFRYSSFCQLLRDSLNPNSLSGALINVHENALQEHPVLRYLKLLRNIGDESFDNWFDFASDHAFVRTGKPGIAKKGGAARKDLFVGGLHVRMCADHGTGFSV